MTTMPECDLLGSGSGAPPRVSFSAQRKRIVPRADGCGTEIAREFPHNRRLARIRAKVGHPAIR